MKRVTFAAALALVVALPAAGAAQQHQRASFSAPELQAGSSSYNEFSMEPYAGVFFDPFVAGGSEMGPLLGVRIGYEAFDRMRLLADFGYSEVNGVGTVTSGASSFTFGNDWIFTLGGFEFDVVPGGTSGTVSLMGGAAWRQTDVERRVSGTDDDPDLGGFSTMGVIAPGVGLRQQLGRRATFRLSIQDFILDFAEDPQHAPALTLGISFR